MKKRSKSTNDGLVSIIELLNKTAREKNASIWKDIAKRIASPRKNRTELNVSRLGRHTKAKDVVAVPGKLLGSGVIGHDVTVAALSFSASAKEKISSAGGKCISFDELLKTNPRGSNVKIMRGV
jgi:large subunit ribosomal protein L18e